MHLRVQEAYTNFEFHKVFHTLHGICATELSSFYLDVLKDRLYSSLPDSQERRSAQSAMYEILLLLLCDMAPILTFTAEEIFRHLPSPLRPVNAAGDAVLTVLAMPQPDVARFEAGRAARQIWENILAIRAEVTKAIEPLRKNGVVGHSLDTRIVLYLDPALQKAVKSSGADMRAVCIVSQAVLADLRNAPVDAVMGDLPGLAVEAGKARGEKCQRCWIYSEELGSDPAHPSVCPRCAEVLRSLPQPAEAAR